MSRASIEEGSRNNFSHFTHEHPLQQAVSGQGGNTRTCSGCEMSITAGKDYYTCRTCSFSLHRVCFSMPSSCQHRAEPGHNLFLVLAPSFQCKACGIQGSGFCYTCDICDTYYHSLCLKLPAVERCGQHPPHELQLMFTPPYDSSVGFKCDVCQRHGPNQWLYRCNSCEFDVHLNCVYAAPSATTHSRNLPSLPSQTPSPLPMNNYNLTSSLTATNIPGATYYTRGQVMHNPSAFPMNNYNLASPSNASNFPCAPYNTGDQIMQPGQFIMYQSQVAPALSTGSVLIPHGGNPMISLSHGAIPYNPALSYHLPANGNLGNQMGSYAYTPVMSSGQNGFIDMGVPSNVAYGVRSTNQPGGFGYPQEKLGGGLLDGTVATGILSGLGQGIGGALVNTVIDAFGGSDN